MDEIADLFAYRRPTPRLTGPACTLRWQRRGGRFLIFRLFFGLTVAVLCAESGQRRQPVSLTRPVAGSVFGVELPAG